MTTPVFMAQGRRDFLFGIDQGAQAFQRLRGPKALYVGLHGHAPSTFPAAGHRRPDDSGARVVRLLSQERALRSRDQASVYVAPENFKGQVPRRGGTLPPVSPNVVAFPGVSTFAKIGKAVRSAPLRKAVEVYGSPTLRTSVAASGGWSRLVAVLTARTPQGKEIVVSAGGVPTKPGAQKLTIKLASQATFIPRGSRLTLTLGSSSLAQSTSNLLYLDLPMAATARVRVGSAVLTLPGLRTPVTQVRLALAAAALAALALASLAGARPAADPGVTATSILLGGTVPLTGEAAAFGAVGPGAKAYFDYVNAKGGVHGRKIEYRFYDDAYNPAQTVQLTRRLVEQDRVFAVFNSLGTANNLAIREYLNAQKVPQLFAGDGSRAIGTGSARYPWTMGFLMSYRGEGDVYGKTLVQSRPRARVAVLYENTELGTGHAHGAHAGDRGEGAEDRGAGVVRAHRLRRELADRAAEGVGRGHADALRDAEVLHPGAWSRPTSSRGSRASTSRRSRSSRGSCRSRG